MTIRIYYEDTDIGGVVYYANYLKFCERARSELFFAQGLSPMEGSHHFIVKSLKADYLKSATLGDEITVETRLLQMKKASVILKQSVLRNEEKLFIMEVELVCMEKQRIARIPESFKAVLEELTK